MLQAKQQGMHLLLELMKCQGFGLSSRDYDVNSVCCLCPAEDKVFRQLLVVLCHHAHPSGMTRLLGLHNSLGRHLLDNTQRRKFTLESRSALCADLFISLFTLKILTYVLVGCFFRLQ